MIERITAALEGQTRAVHDELSLHAEIARAFDRAGIPYQREVAVPGSGRIDFVVEESIAIEVKAAGQSGLGPFRQLLGYLEDRRFTAGVLICVKATSLPLSHYTRADGTTVPLHKIELWKNAL